MSRLAAAPVKEMVPLKTSEPRAARLAAVDANVAVPLNS
jgi:hypothetical protein